MTKKNFKNLIIHLYEHNILLKLICYIFTTQFYYLIVTSTHTEKN